MQAVHVRWQLLEFRVDELTSASGDDHIAVFVSTSHILPYIQTLLHTSKMAKDPTLKKKRKSEAMLDAAAPAEGSTSAQAVVAEVDAEHAEKKAKKEKKDKKKKQSDGDVTMATDAGDVTVDESSKKDKKKEKVSSTHTQ